MKRTLITAALVLLILSAVLPVTAEEFHSEFGVLPPEIPSGNGMTAKELDNVFAQIDRAELPPAFRLRRVYEWVMLKYGFDPDRDFAPDQETDPEAVSLCLTQMIKDGSSGDAGFALLAHYLLGRLGHPSVIISGELELPDGSLSPHQWNYVFFSGKWYHFDPLAEQLDESINGFMNVEKDLSGSALKWDTGSLPASAEYPVRALGCECSFD